MDTSNEIVRGTMCLINRETILLDERYKESVDNILDTEDANGSFIVYFSGNVCAITNVAPPTFSDDNFFPDGTIFVDAEHLAPIGKLEYDDSFFSRWDDERAYQYMEKVAPNAPKNEKMRILNRQGITVSSIAKLMGVSYQRVKNVIR